MTQLTKLSLFSGILGDDLASEWAGIKTVCCVEIDPFCQRVIKYHYPDMPIIGDIHEVTKAKLKEVSGQEWVDIISGGDPCQPRSVAGKRRGRADDRDLWKDMFRVVCELKPTWVVNENPAGRLSMDFNEVLADLESQGYETRSFLIPACAVNAPHQRDRLFIVAFSESNRSGRKQHEPGYSRLQQDSSRRQGIYGGEILQDSESTRPCGSGVNDTHSNLTGLEIGESIGGHDGTELSPSFRRDWNKSWIEVATALCGMDDGFPDRVARLKALGNACVPQQVYPIYRAIAGIERNGAKVKKIQGMQKEMDVRV